MADNKQLTDAVEQIIAEELGKSFSQVRADVGRRLADELVVPGNVGEQPVSELLREATTRIQGATAQVEILDALLEGCASFFARSAIFVVRGNTVAGWRARGFSDDEIVRTTPLELGNGLAAQAISSRATVWDDGRVQAQPVRSWVAGPRQVLTLPLVVRDRCVALLYADGGDRRG